MESFSEVKWKGLMQCLKASRASAWDAKINASAQDKGYQILKIYSPLAINVVKETYQSFYQIIGLCINNESNRRKVIALAR